MNWDFNTLVPIKNEQIETCEYIKLMNWKHTDYMFICVQKSKSGKQEICVKSKMNSEI